MNKEELEEIIYTEGNFIEFINKTSGYECRIIRPYPLSHLCGYVRVPEGHPLFGKRYAQSEYKGPYYDIKVHGGITFSNNMGIKGTWWIGFDCCHLGDLSPRDYLTYKDKPLWKDDAYRTVDFVRNECNKLARQLKKIEEKIK